MVTKIKAASRLQQTENTKVQAGFISNRLAEALKGDDTAIADMPQLIDQAARNAASQLEALSSQLRQLGKGKVPNAKKLAIAALKQHEQLLKALG